MHTIKKTAARNDETKRKTAVSLTEKKRKKQTNKTKQRHLAEVFFDEASGGEGRGAEPQAAWRQGRLVAGARVLVERNRRAVAHLPSPKKNEGVTDVDIVIGIPLHKGIAVDLRKGEGSLSLFGNKKINIADGP